MFDDAISQVGRSAAQAGAKVVSRYFADLASAGIADKTTDAKSEGLVTAADVEAESAIVELIRSNYPDHSFLAEEAYSETITAEHLWVIDPLDGTNNFAHGIPHFAVSVAYYKNGEAIYGIVIDVARGHVYECGRGLGAWADGKQVHVNQHESLAQTMVGVGFYYDRGEMMQATLESVGLLFAENIHGIRRFGTAALDLIHVGLGRFGAFFEYTLSPWDFAAGRLFVQEAGGTVTTCSGEDLPLDRCSVLATNRRLHPAMLEIVSHYPTKQ
jgi:myo-inositol-1(or 4)-monophosphatase